MANREDTPGVSGAAAQVRPTLLLADNSLTIRRVIELTFADEPIRVVTVGDGREAIERIAAEPPDIVLADIGTSERDGYAIAEFVKRDPRLAHIPVLLLAGAFEPIDEARAQAAGCEGVLVKPFEPQVVIGRVRDLLSGRKDAGRSTTAAAGERPSPGMAPAHPDDYFNRLDAAFAAVAPPVSSRGALPGLDTASNASGGQTPSQALPRTAGGGAVSLVEAFAALLSAERSQPVAPPAPFASWMPDPVIDAIAARVIQRMGDDTMRQAVLDAAERMVGDEIARIKQTRTPDRP